MPRTTGARGVEKLICAGPGSTLMTWPGYDPAKEPGEYEFSKANVFKGANQLAGKLTGGVSASKQVQFNVDRVMEILAALPDPKPGIINMAGKGKMGTTVQRFGQKSQSLHFGKQPDEDMSKVFGNLFKDAA